LIFIFKSDIIIVEKKKEVIRMMDVSLMTAASGMLNLSTEIQVAVLRNSLDLVEATGEGIQKIMESSVMPHLGQNIDISL